MSRTYRKTDYTDSVTKETYVREAIVDWIARPTRLIRRRCSKEVYEARVAKAHRDFEARVAANRGNTEAIVKSWRGGYTFYTIRCERVSRWEYEEVEVTREECIAEAEYDYAKFKRDGRWKETSLKSGFKNDAAKKLRRDNKNFCRKAMDDDHDNTSYPDRCDGKRYIWDWW